MITSAEPTIGIYVNMAKLFIFFPCYYPIKIKLIDVMSFKNMKLTLSILFYLFLLNFITFI